MGHITYIEVKFMTTIQRPGGNKRKYTFTMFEVV